MNIAAEFSRSGWSSAFLAARINSHVTIDSIKKDEATRLTKKKLFINESIDFIKKVQAKSSTEKKTLTFTKAKSFSVVTRGSTQVRGSTRSLSSRKDTSILSCQSSELKSIYSDGSYFAAIALDRCGSCTDLPNLSSAKSDAVKLRTHLVNCRNFVVIGEKYNEDATSQGVRELFACIKKTLKDKPNSRLILFMAMHTVHVHDDDESWLALFGFNDECLEVTGMEIRKVSSSFLLRDP